MQTVKCLNGFGIAIVERGFVYVGDISHDGEWCIVSNARNIRRWGTSKGLGQLAIEGPQDETQLDDVGIVRIPSHALISIMDTAKAKWIS